ncbi:PAS domain-containing protein [Polyangium spumosum]|uniref:PAS domain-containing protein n=1 Tax=Polyangium spumosum TaxID=889282 RepID=A0A6N7Q1X1_9BACT|nr:PAS domain-containing protein [Polyangium spumosum]MRG96254.1 PAS domain-containing protein [Polyangium spumosum]
MSNSTVPGPFVFLSSRAPEMSAAITRDALDELPMLAKAGAAEAAAWAEAAVGVALRALDGAAGLEALGAHVLSLAAKGAPAEEVGRALALCRRHFLRACVRALPEVPGAAEGIERLSACFDVASEALLQHYAALATSGHDATVHRQNLDRLERSRAEVQAILDNAPIVVFVKDLDGVFTFSNRQFDENCNLPRGWILGKRDGDFLPPETVKQNRDNDALALAAGRPLESEEIIPTAEGTRIYMVSKFPLFNTNGEPYAVCGVSLDITARKQAEEERAQLAKDIIDAQHVALRALSTPLLPIARGVVLMPLIGAIDATRAALVLETLLDGVGAHQAEVAILDITGLREVDADVASGIVQAAQAAALLGAEVVLTGVRPAAARALIELGVDMRGLKTLSTLQQGVTYAITRSRARAR